MIPADPQTGRERKHWRPWVHDRQDRLVESGFSVIQAYCRSLEERLTDEWMENERLWDQADEIAALQEDAREMAWLLRRCHAEARFFDAEELKQLLTAWTVAHQNEYEPAESTT